MKFPSVLLTATLAIPLLADTVYTIPQGYTKITIAAATPSGPALTAVSATLLQDVSFAGSSNTISSYDSANSTQTITSASATWAADQWTSDPHLVYVKDSSGSEEAFLIQSHTADTLTISTNFDLLGDADPGAGVVQRFPTSTSIKIRKANTISTLFGSDSDSVSLKSGFLVTIADNIFVWDGSSWITYYFSGSAWQRIGGSSPTPAADDVIFPDEGIFVFRRDTTDVVLTLFGEVPSAPQIATVPGDGLTFVSTRFPIGATIDQMGFDDLPNWKKFFLVSNADKVFSWTGSDWITYYHDGSNWQVVAPSGSGITVNDSLPANSAIFVSRVGTADSPISSGAIQSLPYNPSAE